MNKFIMNTISFRKVGYGYADLVHAGIRGDDFVRMNGESEEFAFLLGQWN